MKKRILAALLASSLLFTACGAVYEYGEKKVYGDTVSDREDAGIRLEDDFYGYINFDFLQSGRIPPRMREYSMMRGLEMDIDRELTEEIISAANGPVSPDSGRQAIRELYRQYLDTESRERAGMSAFDGIIGKLRDTKDRDGFISVCGEMYTEYGCAVLFYPYVIKDRYAEDEYIMCLYPMELIYSADGLLNEKGSAFRLQEGMAEVFSALDIPDPDGTAYGIMTMLLGIAGSTKDIEKADIGELYNIYGSSGLEELSGGADIMKCFGIGNAEKIAVFDTEQTETVCGYINGGTLELWKSYALFRLMYDYRDCLTGEAGNAFSKLMPDSMSDEERAAEFVKSNLVGVLDRIYSEKHCDEEKINAVKEMTNDIKSAYGKIISDSAALDAAAEKALLGKLENIRVNVGPSDSAYAAPRLGKDLLSSCIGLRKSAVSENLSLCGSVYKEVFDMPQFTVNAYYSPSDNSINIPLSMTGYPLFDENTGRYENLGKLGYIIAHELGHAFDEQGAKYDERGCYSPLFTGENYSAGISVMKKRFSGFFSEYRIMRYYRIDGNASANENIADTCAMYVLSDMTDDRDELRTLFESYAELWATLSYDTDTVSSLSDTHSPAEVRVNRVLSATDKFYFAYGITENDGMYVPPENRPRVW